MRNCVQGAGCVTNYAPTALLNLMRERDTAILSVHCARGVAFAWQHARRQQSREGILPISRYLLRLMDYFAIMDEKLIPAHILFAKWFVRIRWIALFILIISTFAVRHIFNISIQETQIFILSGILLVLNILHNKILKRITRKGSTGVIRKIKYEIHFQIITDLIILTLIIHFSGGIESPDSILFFSSDYRQLDILHNNQLPVCGFCSDSCIHSCCT